ncbi:ABC transporter permease [Flavihumibacter sp. ZG627]|uniref:ABC transporter permease n=1 Tax=Flavihumibacter sp. ZG627 TaxID=1463156 RepID=UPI00057E42AE|nr:FtsX-like permease family protein [Flavihumibacter sp. ZG627]KIC91360.1 ABC transporter permease [Flavihumibacter sp. ZG627]
MSQYSNKGRLNFAWLFRMAWHDSRRSRSRLLLFISSIILGIAALVAIYSLRYTVQGDIDKQAKELLGADLVIEANIPAGDALQPLLDSIGDQKATEQSFASMVYFLRTGGTRLVQIRAVEGNYPFYGSIRTNPVNAAKTYQAAQQALVDKTLMLQYQAKLGDSIKIGELTFTIAGEIDKVPGKTGFSAAVAPGIFIPLRYLAATGLSQRGSRINYSYYFKYDNPVDINALVEKIEPRIEDAGFDIDTVEAAKNNTGNSFEDFTSFMNLVSFIALLLGCIGVASAIHIYIREKLNSIAVLRCLGATGKQAFLIYLIQVSLLGLLGSIAGAIAGTAIQFLLPAVLEDFLPVDITMQISWKAIAQGIFVGLLISVLFSLLPLSSIRNIAPLNTLRITETKNRFLRDPLQWLVYLLILAFVLGFSWLQMNNWMQAVVFTIGVLAAFGILAGMAWLIMWVTRKYFPESWSYLWRQGFANLFRPHNQTVILVVAIGLGTTFICLLFFVQHLLTNKVALSSSENQPNMVIFDIQPEQKEPIAAITRKFNLPVIQEVPIVTMRIEEINGITATMARQDSTLDLPRWAFEGEVRSTYRDSLTDTETLLEGKLQTVAPSDTDVRISMEDGYAKRLHVGIGDTIVFNVQGALVSTVVGSLRKVDWNRVQTNFRVIFPKGVLESAPKFHVLITRVPSKESSASFQRAVVSAYPTVSMIDLGLILSVVDDILSKIAFVIRFIGGFSIATGLVVLIASILISKYQRIQETVLLRTLGASRRQVLTITALEYFFLGALAAITGILLALAGGWALAVFSFKTVFAPPVLPTLLIFLSISALTVMIGLFNSRSILNAPPKTADII